MSFRDRTFFTRLIIISRTRCRYSRSDIVKWFKFIIFGFLIAIGHNCRLGFRYSLRPAIDTARRLIRQWSGARGRIWSGSRGRRLSSGGFLVRSICIGHSRHIGAGAARLFHKSRQLLGNIRLGCRYFAFSLVISAFLTQVRRQIWHVILQTNHPLRSTVAAKLTFIRLTSLLRAIYCPLNRSLTRFPGFCNLSSLSSAVSLVKANPEPSQDLVNSEAKTVIELCLSLGFF